MTANPNPQPQSQRRPVPARPVQARPVPPPASGNRTFSKQIVVGVILAMTALAGYGLHTGNPQTSEIIGSYGLWASGLVAMYMAVGQLDYRTSKGVPSIMDVLTLLVTRGRG